MSNLETFLEAATPHLRWRSAPMDCLEAPSNVWQLDKKHAVDYFTLEDLWEHYSESSAYGLAVPLRLDQPAGSAHTIITQHFVPYLSAIQIYTSAKTLGADAIPNPSRSTGSETDSWSDDSIADDKFSRSWDAASDDDDFDFNFNNPAKQSGYLNFQYREWDPPYERPPLADKVAELAQDYPCLMSLKSAELSPSSWLSVAWYPIYHIPYHGSQLKGTCACFLTYHSLSSVFQDKILPCGDGADSDGSDSDRTVAIAPFGLATYRMEGKLWRDEQPSSHAASMGSSSSNGWRNHHRLSDDLYWAASSWLKQVGAHHPDFNYFTSHSSSPPAAIIASLCFAADAASCK